MYRVTLMYPKTEGEDFDYDYYVEKHMPFAAEQLGDACISWDVDKVVFGPYHVIGHINVTSLEEFKEITGAARAEFTADIQKCTKIVPAVVMSEVIEGKS